MKIIFFGSDEFSLPLIKALEVDHEIVAVITQPDKPQGRGRKIMPNPVAKWAVSHNKRIFYDMNQSEILSLDADIGVVAAYGRIIPEKLLNFPKYRLINLHPSLLPRYRGATPIETAILNGDEKTGCSVIYVEKKLDSGDILAMREYPLDRENSIELRRILAEMGTQLVIDVIENIENLHPIRQDESQAIYTKKIAKSDAEIFFAKESASLIDRKIRAYIAIGSYFYLNGKRIIVQRADFDQANSGKPPGYIVEAKDRLTIQTKDGLLHIKQVKPAGKKSMSAKQFVNGYKDLAKKFVDLEEQ